MARRLAELNISLDVATGIEEATDLGSVIRYGVAFLDVSLEPKPGEAIERFRPELRPRRVVTVTSAVARAGQITRSANSGTRADATVLLSDPWKVDQQIQLALQCEAGLRRPRDADPSPLTVDVPARCAYVRGVRVALTSLEARLLDYMLAREGEVLARSNIAWAVWSSNGAPASNTLAVHIRQLG